MKSKIAYFILSLILFVLTFTINWGRLFSDALCLEKERIEKIGIYGVVLSKFEDANNHSNNTIVISSLNRKFEQKLYFINEKSGFYEIINVGDTIYKTMGSLEITVNSKTEKYQLDYDCEE